MKGDLFCLVPRILRRLFRKELSFQPRSGCKALSHPPVHGRVYLRKSLRVGVSGEKVDFFQGRGNGLHLRSTVPLGRAAPFCGYPAINRRATLDCPSGTIPEFGLTPPRSLMFGNERAETPLLAGSCDQALESTVFTKGKILSSNSLRDILPKMG